MDRLLSRDIVLRILAVLLALVLWVQATAEQNPEDQSTFDGLSVGTEDIPEATVVVGSPRPPKVNLTVRCGRRLAEKLTAASFLITVSLEGGHVGTNNYPVQVTLPAGVELVQITPALVSVTLEELGQVEVPVTARLAGASPEGYQAGPWTASPSAVLVRGPASATSQVVTALAQCDISEATSEISRTVILTPLDASGAAVAGVTLIPVQALITVPVVALPAPESVDVNPVLTGSPAAGYAVLRVVSRPDRVSLRPEPGRSIDFDRLDTTPINISGLTSDLVVVVGLVPAEGVAATRPSEVEVTVVIGGSLSLSRVPVEVRNTGPGLSASVEPASVDLVIRGPRPILDQIDATNVVVWVDAAGYRPGSATVRVNVDLPDWLEGRAEVFTCRPEEVRLTVGP